jgi:hypothetical protein
MTKQDSIQKFKDQQDALIGQVFDDGVASVPASPDVQSQIDAAVAAAKAEVQGHVDDLQKIVDQDVIDKAALQGKLDQIKALLG